jgi:hypothetical protein
MTPIPDSLIHQIGNMILNEDDPDFTPWDFQCTIKYLISEYGKEAVDAALELI